MGRRLVAGLEEPPEGDRGATAGGWDWAIPEDRLRADGVAAGLLGLDPAEARAGVPLARLLEGVHPDDRAALAPFSGAAPTFRTACRILGPDGAARRVELRGEIEWDAEGHPARCRGTVRGLVDGEGAHPADPLQALDAAAGHCLAARAAIAAADLPLVRQLLDMALVEIARELARAEPRPERH